MTQVLARQPSAGRGSGAGCSQVNPSALGPPSPALAKASQKETSSGFTKEKKIYFFPSVAPRSSQRVCEMALCNGQFQKWKLSSCEFQPRQMFWRVPELRILQHLRGCVRTRSRTCCPQEAGAGLWKVMLLFA